MQRTYAAQSHGSQVPIKYETNIPIAMNKEGKDPNIPRTSALEHSDT